MFGVMDLENGRCFGVNVVDIPFEKYYRGYEVIAFRHIVVPKDYINYWESGYKCNHEGCFKDGNVECHVPNYLDYGSKGVDILKYIAEMYRIEHLCQDHAYEAGYCTLCGEFWGGIESFDFDNPQQLCENCLEQLKDEIGEMEDINGEDEDGYYS